MLAHPLSLLRTVALAAALSVFSVSVEATEITGAGSTFAYPLLAKWAVAYKLATGLTITYQATGSGAGIKQIQGRTVDFGVSDMPLKAEDLEKSGLIQFPVMIGGVVPILNVTGVGPGPFRLDGQTLADIYLGKIVKWDDPALAKLNPGLKLPDKAITPVYRLDGSGTTFIFTEYLMSLSPEWKQAVGAFTTVEFPVGIGARGNEGVTELVGRTSGSIGYVEYAYAKQGKLAHAVMKNTADQFVAPSSDSFQAAAANADWSKASSFFVLLTNQPGARTWPITGSTFVLMHKTQAKADVAKAVLGFFDWAYRNGSPLAGELDYVAMPLAVTEQVEETWKAVTSADGQPIWTGPKM